MTCKLNVIKDKNKKNKKNLTKKYKVTHTLCAELQPGGRAG